MKKVYIQTWGCQMNAYDSEKMADILHHTQGYELTEIAEEAQLLILNTCSIREKAQEKVFSQLGRWRELKSANPNIIIAVGGCVASQEGGNIKKRAPYVDLIFGPQTLHRLPEMIEQYNSGNKSIIDVSFPEIEKFDAMPEPRAEGPVAFVSVIEGCNKYCSFCVVPYTRGEEVSRPLDSIIFEVTQLAEQGVREINLLGQNVNAYRGLKSDGSICSFAELLTYVASVPGIDRLRFITSHPIEFSDDIIEVYKTTPELVSYLHLPVQSGSDEILNRMKRNHTVLEYKHIIRKLRLARPDILLSSDFIVGYPDESDEDFEMTMNLIADLDFDVCYSFIYSARPGTPAAEEADDIADEIKKQRLQILQNRVNQQVQNHSRAMLGSEQIVLIEGISKKNVMELTGRTPANRIVNFTASPDLIGTFVKIKITDVYANSLRGQVVATEDQLDLFQREPILTIAEPQTPKFTELR